MKRIAIIILVALLIGETSTAAKRPKIISPAEGMIITTVNPVLKWEYKTQGKVMYEVKISEDPYFNKNVIEFQTNFMALTCAFPYFQRGGIYYWSVRAVTLNANGSLSVYSDWSHVKMKKQAEYSFSIARNAIGYNDFSPVSLTPSKRMNLKSLQPVLKWKTKDFANVSFKIKNVKGEFISPRLSEIKYKLVLASDSTFTKNKKVFNITGNQDSLYLSIPVLKPGETYFWKVMMSFYNPVKDRTENTNWSDKSAESIISTFSTTSDSHGQFTFDEGLPEQESGELQTGYNLEKLVSGDANNYAPAVSMDGRQLAFISDRLGHPEIFVKSLETRRTGGETQKTVTQPNKFIFNPFWLHNDMDVGFFANLYSDEKWHLFSSNRGTSVTILSVGMDMKEDPQKFNLFGSCSSDGRVVFSSKFEGNSGYLLYLLDLNDDSRTQLRTGLFPDIRDDDKIVFCSNETGNYDIWLVNIEGRSIFRPTLLNTDPADDYDPAFSPGGSKIAFTSNRSGNSDIWIMNADGTGLRQVTFHPMVDRRPQWIDEHTLIFQSNRTTNTKGEYVNSIFMIGLNE